MQTIQVQKKIDTIYGDHGRQPSKLGLSAAHPSLFTRLCNVLSLVTSNPQSTTVVITSMIRLQQICLLSLASRLALLPSWLSCFNE